MRLMYANLLGNWENLNDDPDARVFNSSPSVYIEEELQDMFDYDYVKIYYKGTEYRVHPTHIQVIYKD